MTVRVREVLAPGDLVLLLTDNEIRNLEAPIRETLVPPLFRREQPLEPTTLALLRALTSTTRQRRYDHLLVDPRDTHAQEIEGDEEIMSGSDQVANVIHSLDIISRMMARSRGEYATPVTGTVGGEVKKVLNMDTFNRVCPIHLPTIVDSPPPTTESPEDNDTVGGPQDAGLGACSVCLALLVNRSKSPEELRKMPNCVHIFHSTCLAQWLTKNAITCPVCREPAVTEKKDYGYLGYGTNADTYVPALSTEMQADDEPELPAWIPVFPYTGGVIARRRA